MDPVVGDLLAGDLQGTATDGGNAEDSAHHLGNARALQAGHADDLASADGQIHVPEALTGEVLQFQYGFADLTATIDLRIGIGITNHQAGNFFHGGFGDISVFDKFAVSQDGITVRDSENLVHLVGDEDKGMALFLQSVDDLEQVVNFVLVQGRGRFVQNQQLCIGKQRLGNFQELLLTGLQFGNHCVGINVDTQAVKQFPGLGDHCFFVEGSGFGQNFLAQEDIFIHLQVVEQVQFLVDEGNAGTFGHGNGGVFQGPAVEFHFAGITGVHARKNVHQRRFTRAVFTQKGMYFAPGNREVDAFKHLDTGKRLGYIRHFEHVHIFATPLAVLIGIAGTPLRTCPQKFG